MSIQNTLDEIEDLFSIFDDPKDKFSQLMDIAKESNGIPESDKSDKSKVSGCTSQAWVICEKENDNYNDLATNTSKRIIMQSSVIIIARNPKDYYVTTLTLMLLLPLLLLATITTTTTTTYLQVVSSKKSLILLLLLLL